MPLVKGRKVHWLDKVADELYTELQKASQGLRDTLSDDVPLGSVEATPEEQISQFAEMTAREHAALRQQIGDEQYFEYVGAMKDELRKQLGPMADFVMADFMDQVDEMAQSPIQQQGLEGADELTQGL